MSALAFEPRKAFEEIAQRPRFLFPLLLVLVCTAGLTMWYYAVVDVQWFMDQSLRSGPLAGRLTAEQIEQTLQRSSRSALMVQTAIVLPIFVVLFRLLEATYYLLVAKITNVPRGFRQWFALACWTSLPGVLAIVPAALVLTGASNAQLPQEELQPLSLNSLFFHREVGERGYTILTYVSLLGLAGVFLTALGVKHWSGRSWLYSVLFAALPVLLLVAFYAFT
jgi:hypothetical protein